MDDVLSSRPNAFKMLRAFWKLSFIKFDDEENQAFKDIILKRNQDVLASPTEEGVFDFHPNHEAIGARVQQGDYSLASGMIEVLKSASESTLLRHEMALEAGVLHQISVGENDTRDIFGDWDYLTHQVIASPFKPIDYMDKMDLFGYAHIPNLAPTRARFLVGEVKRAQAEPNNIDQLLKYVDWVKDEYCFGDYSMIYAYLVAHNFDDQVIERAQVVGVRNYTVGVRPAISGAWRNLRLVRYKFNPRTSKLDFDLILDCSLASA